MGQAKKYDNTPKGEKKKKKEVILKWDDLKESRDKCLSLNSEPHVYLETIKEENSEVFEKSEKARAVYEGLNQTFFDLTNKILEISYQHGIFEEGHNPLKGEEFDIANIKYATGEIDKADVDAVLKYHKIQNEYQGIAFSIGHVGTDSLAQIVTTIQEESNFDKSVLDEFNANVAPIVQGFKDSFANLTMAKSIEKAVPSKEALEQAKEDIEKARKELDKTTLDEFKRTIDNLPVSSADVEKKGE